MKNDHRPIEFLVLRRGRYARVLASEMTPPELRRLADAESRRAARFEPCQGHAQHAHFEDTFELTCGPCARAHAARSAALFEMAAERAQEECHD